MNSQFSSFICHIAVSHSVNNVITFLNLQPNTIYFFPFDCRRQGQCWWKWRQCRCAWSRLYTELSNSSDCRQGRLQHSTTLAHNDKHCPQDLTTSICAGANSKNGNGGNGGSIVVRFLSYSGSNTNVRTEFRAGKGGRQSKSGAAGKVLCLTVGAVARNVLVKGEAEKQQSYRSDKFVINYLI